MITSLILKALIERRFHCRLVRVAFSGGIDDLTLIIFGGLSTALNVVGVQRLIVLYEVGLVRERLVLIVQSMRLGLIGRLALTSEEVTDKVYDVPHRHRFIGRVSGEGKCLIEYNSALVLHRVSRSIRWCSICRVCGVSETLLQEGSSCVFC